MKEHLSPDGVSGTLREGRYLQVFISVRSLYSQHRRVEKPRPLPQQTQPFLIWLVNLESSVSLLKSLKMRNQLGREHPFISAFPEKRGRLTMSDLWD